MQIAAKPSRNERKAKQKGKEEEKNGIPNQMKSSVCERAKAANARVSIWRNQSAPKINKTCRIHCMHLFWNGSIYSNPWNDGFRQRLTTHTHSSSSSMHGAISHHLKYKFWLVWFFSLFCQRNAPCVCGGLKFKWVFWKWVHCGSANKDKKREKT